MKVLEGESGDGWIMQLFRGVLVAASLCCGCATRVLYAGWIKCGGSCRCADVARGEVSRISTRIALA
jgi:hypothetical protein